MPELLVLMLCGDVMTGRGIDQILPHPSAPGLFEPYVMDARDYVLLAEEGDERIPVPVDFTYPWGDVLPFLERRRPDCSIINLETSVTTSATPWPGKGIHYRMHPENVPVLAVAGVDVCTLANNHVLDWGREGLAETLTVLERNGLQAPGAGGGPGPAMEPAILPLPEQRRLLVFSCCVSSSGVPDSWAAVGGRPGVARLPDLGPETFVRTVEHVRGFARPGDLVVFSIHWGPNWGYEIPDRHVVFARGLVEQAGVDLVHGHSSHHPLPWEVHEGRLILYGCGDFINDYEGISGHEKYRSELRPLYLPALDPTSGVLRRLEIVPFVSRRLRLERAGRDDAAWLARTLTREGRRFGTEIGVDPEGILTLEVRP